MPERCREKNAFVEEGVASTLRFARGNDDRMQRSSVYYEGSAKSLTASAVNPNVWDETAEDKTEGLAEKRRERTENRLLPMRNLACVSKS